MKDLSISGKVIRVRATPLALLFYRQAFKGDLLGDLIKMVDIENDLSKLDTVALLQLIWSMAKADQYPSSFPSFESWLASLETVDFSDESVFRAALEEAADGFLRNRIQAQQQAQSRRTKKS